WGKNNEGRIVKIDIVCPPCQLEITKHSPLYLTITFDNVLPFETGVRYMIGVEQQAAAKPPNRTKKAIPTSVNEKKDMFILRAAEGAPDNPTNMVLDLTDTGDRISITKDKPFKRI